MCVVLSHVVLLITTTIITAITITLNVLIYDGTHRVINLESYAKMPLLTIKTNCQKQFRMYHKSPDRQRRKMIWEPGNEQETILQLAFEPKTAEV